MTIGCNIWMICLILIWFFYGLSRMFQLPQFVLALRSSVWDVFVNFLLIDATDRSKISSDQTHFLNTLSLYPLSFFANTPFKINLYIEGLARSREKVVVEDILFHDLFNVFLNYLSVFHVLLLAWRKAYLYINCGQR